MNHQRVVEITNNSAYDVNRLFSTQEEVKQIFVCYYMSMTLRRGMELELPLFGHQILMCLSCAWHFRRRLILISGIRLAQNKILNTFLCINLLRNLATTCARSCFLSILYWVAIVVTMQNRWNNRISDGCVYAQIRKGLGMHLVTYSNHDTVPFLLIVPIKGRFV